MFNKMNESNSSNISKSENVSYSKQVYEKENIGTCFSTKQNVSVNVEPSNPTPTTFTTNEFHVNNNCVLTGVGIVAATIVQPEIGIPIVISTAINK